MLMSNAQKVLQTVAANVDTDILEPLLQYLYDMIMLTDTSGILTGEEQIKVLGSQVAIQRDTLRQKQLQFLQITANPIDGPIIGEIGRARVLRAVAQDLGLPDDVVPDDQTLQSQMDAQKRMQAASQAMLAHAQGQGAQVQGPPGSGPPGQQRGKPGGGAGSPPAGNAPSPTPAQHSDNAPPVNSFSQGIGG
jgi:hypothetical protein